MNDTYGRMSRETHEGLKATAKSRGMTLKAALDAAVRNWLAGERFSVTHVCLVSDGHDLVVSVAEQSEGPWIDVIRSRGDGKGVSVIERVNIEQVVFRKGQSGE